ncbi:MAG: TlpA disulfide reductase family protein [Planctomycetota bacterium]
MDPRLGSLANDMRFVVRLIFLSTMLWAGCSPAPNSDLDTGQMQPEVNAALQATRPTKPVDDATSTLATDTMSGLPPFQPANPSPWLPEPLPSARRESLLDLSPVQLIEFLADTDADLRAIAQGQPGMTTEQDAVAALHRTVALKQLASERLLNHPDADPREVIIGQRGILQSLSQLASLGDLEAAVTLETMANDWQSSDDANLSADSRLVLIGFTIERLQHGKPNASSELVTRIRSFVDEPNPSDVAALMVMGQARDALVQYGYQQEAEQVESMISQEFAGTSDPIISQMAEQIAAATDARSSATIRRAEMFRERLIAQSQGTTTETLITVDQWQAMLDDLIRDHPTATTAKYLAGLSLDAESVERADLASATYSAMTANLNRFDAAGIAVLRTALDARDNRLSILGQTWDLDLPSVRGQPLSINSYQGKVVLMPFWSSEFPESLSLLGVLRQIQSRDPSKIAIVGVNLDVAERDPVKFMDLEGLDFPSFRSVTDPTAQVANEVAFRFGAVTLSFVAILDPNGQVSGINFSGRGLDDQVARLLP